MLLSQTFVNSKVYIYGYYAGVARWLTLGKTLTVESGTNLLNVKPWTLTRLNGGDPKGCFTTAPPSLVTLNGLVQAPGADFNLTPTGFCFVPSMASTATDRDAIVQVIVQ